MNEPLIRLQHVQRSYPVKAGRTWVLRNINLDIEPGEFISVMGPSGSGKTSLLNVLGMLDGGFEGEYWLDGEAVQELKPERRQALARKHVGFVFQHYHLIDDLTVAENLELPLSYRDVPAKQRAAKVADLLDRFQIVAKKDLYPNQLSGGQQQLVAVARAVISEPSLILADEPTGALHSDQGKIIMELLAELNRDGATIVQVTHNAANAAYGQRILQLLDGWLEPDDDSVVRP
jgi:ABC-type lipoprotein export system ATPase subunit